MPTELDEARDALLEIVAHSVYQLAIATSDPTPEGEQPIGLRMLAQYVDERLTEFVMVRRREQ